MRCVCSRRKSPTQMPQPKQPQEGRVGWDVYLYYVSAAGQLATAGVVLLFCAWTGLLAGSKYWLARWAAAGGRAGGGWLGGYFAIALLALAALFARQVLRTASQVAGGRRLHEWLLEGVFRAPLSFFTRTPTGRILNRFVGDATARSLVFAA